jgi:endogenous inhibitor of DNA gyrase (YacG/DUF329 family)
MKNRCPVCRKTVRAPRKKGPEEAEFFPFCSRRCKLVDLGAWLDAEYKITSDLKSQNSTEQADTSQQASADGQ